MLTILGVVLALLGQIMLSRALGTEHFGRYAIALGWSMVLVTPATAGMDFTLLRFAPVYMADGQLGRLAALLNFAVSVMAATAAGAAIFFLILSYQAPSSLGTSTASGVASIIALTAATAFANALSAVFRANKRIVLSQLYTAIVRPVLFLGMLGLVLATVLPLDGDTALALTAASAVVALFLLFGHVRGSYMTHCAEPVQPALIRDWMLMSGPMLLNASIQQLLTQSNVLYLGTLSTPAQAGHFAVASRLATLVLLGMSALASITSPMIVSAWHAGDTMALQRIALTNARVAGAFAIAATAFFLIFGELVLSAFGKGFDQAWWPLMIMLSGGLAIALVGSTAAQFLTMTGQQTPVLVIMVLSLILHVVLSLSLIPGFGAVGAAAASAAATTASVAAMAWRVRSTLRIDTTLFGAAASVQTA